MLSKPLAFEQDKIAIFLRNQEMHLHFSKLDSIKHRKNIYLPEIPSSNKSKVRVLKKNLYLVKIKIKLNNYLTQIYYYTSFLFF